MERTRVDLSGPSKPSARDSGAPSGENVIKSPKNIALLAVAGVCLLLAAYMVYANFIATGGPPAEESPQVEAVFEEAAKQPPPPEPLQTQFEPGSGKHLGQ